MIRRASRRSLRAGGDERRLAQWRATYLSGVVLWLRGDLGITLNDATIAQPSAFDNAAWIKGNCSVSPNVTTDPFGGNTADSLIEDVATSSHAINQVPGSIVAGLPTTFSVYAKASVRSWIYIYDGTSNINYYNVSTGTLGTHGGSGTASITSVGNGWYLCSMTFAAGAANFIIGLASADNVSSYAGSGAGNVFLSTAAASQPKVSAWADQSGLGHNLTQGTASKQPLLVAGAQNGHPGVRLDGVDDFIASGVFSLVQPEYVLTVYKSISFGGVGAHDLIYDGNTASSMALVANSVPNYGISSSSSINSATLVANGVYVYSECVFNGPSSSIAVSGTGLVAGTVTSLGDTTGFVLGTLGGGPAARASNIEVAEVLIINRVPSVAEQSMIRGYVRARYSL